MIYIHVKLVEFWMQMQNKSTLKASELDELKWLTCKFRL